MYSRFHVQKGSNTMNKSPMNKNSNKKTKNLVWQPKVSAPVATAQKQGFPTGKQDNRTRRVINSELVGSINGTTTFAATVYRVNPGMPATFPWLSVQAAEWQQYRFNSLQFRYVTRTATSTVGSVILSPDYNPNDLSPTTEAQATNTEGAVEDAVWKDLVCRLDPKAMHPNGPRKQIRSTAVAGDLNNYDVAKFSVCTTEEANTNAIGKLWVDYDVELSVPQNSPSDSSGSTSLYEASKAASQGFTTTVGAALQWDAPVYDPLGFGTAASGVFTPPSGTYLLSASLVIADSATERFSGTIAVQKNSAALTVPCVGQWDTTPQANGSVLTIPISCVITCNGTDTIRLFGTMTGAAGTLTFNGSTSRIQFQAV